MYDSPPPPAYYFQLPCASILKSRPDKAPKELTYKDLVCTEQDRANIAEIITTMAQNSPLALGAKRTYLREIGAQISHVHGLKFLGVVFSDADLKACMPDVMGSYFKRSHLMDGIGSSLSREMEKGTLLNYLEDFSKEVGHHPHNTPHLRTYFQSHDWEGLVKFLMRN